MISMMKLVCRPSLTSHVIDWQTYLSEEILHQRGRKGVGRESGRREGEGGEREREIIHSLLFSTVLSSQK